MCSIIPGNHILQISYQANSENECVLDRAFDEMYLISNLHD